MLRAAEDVRFACGEEMLADLRRGHAEHRRRGRLVLARFVCSRVLALLVDVTVERANTLASHRSFHGRGEPDLGVVRPPNMGKKEWFDAAFEKPSTPGGRNHPSR